MKEKLERDHFSSAISSWCIRSAFPGGFLELRGVVGFIEEFGMGRVGVENDEDLGEDR